MISQCAEENVKLKKVLGFFLTPKCRINNDVYLEMLLTHLSAKSDKDVINIDNFACTIEYIETFTDSFSPENNLPNQAILSFSLRLLALVIQNANQFAYFNENGLFDKVETAMKNNIQKTPSVKLAHIKLLSSISKHSNGLQWIKKTKSWLKVINYCFEHHTLYVVREANTCLYEILHKFSRNENEDDLVQEILRKIIQYFPFWDSDAKDIMILVNDSNIQHQISTTVNLLSFILQKSLDSEEEDKILYHILETLNPEALMIKLSTMIYDESLLSEFCGLYELLNFARLDLPSSKDSLGVSLKQFSLCTFNNIYFCLLRESFLSITKISELCHKNWIKMQTRVSRQLLQEDIGYNFENQFIVFQIVPIILAIHQDMVFIGNEHEFLDKYLLKVFDISCEHTIRLCYMYRDHFKKCSNKNVVGYKAIQGILALKNILHRDRAIIVFQTLMYSLKRYIPIDDCPTSIISDTDYLAQNPHFLSAILTGLETLIQQYKITWKECIESIAVLNLMLELLNNPNLTTKLTVQVLKLTQTSIEHFLAPNLALLMDTVKGSGMEKLGPMIVRRLHDKEWETRDSTLELLASMTNLSNIKFPAFQQHILDNTICPIVVQMAKYESEPYVQASALKCISGFVAIKQFWSTFFSTVDLMPFLLKLLANESEGVVRKEAVNVVQALYGHQRIPRNYLDHVFSTIAHCSINDLYWEVKMASLKFWKTVLCHQSKHQGVINGIFPTVTFSAEHKKIVTLTTKEIIIRLRKLNDELSLRGFLGVLLACADDDCDIEVSKEANKIISDVKLFYNQYNYIEESKKVFGNLIRTQSVIDTNYSEFFNNPTESKQVRNDADVPHSKLQKLSADEIIDSIVDSDDLNLLASAYANQMAVTYPYDTIIKDDYYKNYQISGDEFIKTIYSDEWLAKQISKEKCSNETESFESLLDDILLSLQGKESNDADCY